MLRAALYARYSSDLQNPQSIDDQLRVCRQLAAREGWKVVAHYHDEAVSGASIRGRAGMGRLLADARAGLPSACSQSSARALQRSSGNVGQS